jgi:CRISPR system Cascade subunit CasD
MRLAGPMQSWGTDSRFDIRFTGREPSKSGVIGLLCAALGKPREERPGDGYPTLAELSGLRMGVRVDRPGTLRVDYQTAGGTHRAGESYGVVRASGARGETVQSRRYYLADADFLVGLEGEDALLRRLEGALRRPVWQLCLGRKAFVPGVPVWLPDAGPDGEWWSMPLREALGVSDGARGYPWRPRHARERRPERLRVVLDAAPGPDAAVRQDVPVDFAARRFRPRYVVTAWVERPGVEERDVSLAAGVESA